MRQVLTTGQCSSVLDAALFFDNFIFNMRDTVSLWPMSPFFSTPIFFSNLFLYFEQLLLNSLSWKSSVYFEYGMCVCVWSRSSFRNTHDPYWSFDSLFDECIEKSTREQIKGHWYQIKKYIQLQIEQIGKQIDNGIHRTPFNQTESETNRCRQCTVWLRQIFRTGNCCRQETEGNLMKWKPVKTNRKYGRK